MTNLPTTVTEELKAMDRIVKILGGVDGETANRIVIWMFERYHVPEKIVAYDDPSMNY